MWTCIDYQLDFILFAACCAAGLLALRQLAKHCGNQDLSTRICIALTGVLLFLGYHYVHSVDAEQRCNLINQMSAFATTYAGETEKLGHASIPNDVATDDPGYLQLVNAQRRWMRANSLISDIYTMRKTADGTTMLIVDSETDYDHSGSIDNELEVLTPPGEIYDGFDTGSASLAYNNALNGHPAFIAVPYSDQWGQWVTALHPMFDEQGDVEAVLGVDFPAAVWGRQIFNARLSVIGILAVIETMLLTGAALFTLTGFHLRQQEFAANRLQQFKTTLDQTLDSVFMFRPEDFRFIYVNEGARQLLGYSEQQYLQMTPMDIVPGYGHEEMKALTLPLVQGTHQLFTFETTHKHANGHEIPVELSLQFVHQSTDTPRFVGIVRDITERRKIEQELMIAARLDRLTGLPNRALFQDRLKLYIERTRQIPGYQFALMFLDFDRFKIVNDSLGHDVGDALLKEIACRLKDNLRTTDSISTLADGTTVSRLGGDEFVVILDDIDGPEAACQSAAQLISALGEQYQLGDHEVRSNASIGIVCSHARYQRADDMLRDADTAMYEAKARGKACYVVFDDSMRQAAQQRLQTETELRAAIGTRQLSLVWQPIVSLEDGQLHGAEAIIQWNHPKHGLIPSEKFLPIAEETRLSLPISEWVLETACAQFVDWHLRHPGEAPRYVSLNLTGRQMMQEQLTERILAVLQSHGMQPRQLQIEVTEAEIMGNRVHAGEVLLSLSRAGIRLAIDEFGTGYSSLACLQEFPFNVLKMDRTFVANLNDGHEVIAVAHSVVTLAENIGIACVAEGIEDPVQLAVLQSMNCGFGQGNFLCPPGAIEDIIQAPWKHCHHMMSSLVTPEESPSVNSSLAWRAFIGLED